jgi:hypothetical protein
MSRLLIITISAFLCFAQYRPEEHALDTAIILQDTRTVKSDRVPIAPVGDFRSISGPGTNIIVCEHGDVIAVIYAAPSGNPDNPHQIQIAYSLGTGADWTSYGPFSSARRRAYSAVDGPPNFCQVGGLVFVWQENTLLYIDGTLQAMIEENVPSAPSPSVPFTLPNSEPPAIWPWYPDVTFAQDDPTHVVVTAYSYLSGGNEWAYCWVSSDGGWSWTDSIPMVHISPDGAAGNVACGSEGYAVYSYLDYYCFTANDSTPYPYYIESTNGGYTWGPETPVPGVPVNSGSQFRGLEFDCSVMNNEPWLIYKDIGNPGGGPYILHGIGSPGNWTWEVHDAGQLGTCSLTVADTTFYCYPSQYPSIAHDPISNTILASYKAFFYKEYGGTVYYNGPHIGGIYTTDNGVTWIVSQPLSDPDTGQIPWSDWGYIEMAHRLVKTSGDVWAYSIWVDESDLILYFERGLVTSFLPVAINESTWDGVSRIPIRINPSISKTGSNIEFSMPCPGNLEIDLYNVAGRFIKTLIQGKLQGGDYVIPVPTNELPVGVYYVVLTAPGERAVAKFIVMR